VLPPASTRCIAACRSASLSRIVDCDQDKTIRTLVADSPVSSTSSRLRSSRISSARLERGEPPVPERPASVSWMATSGTDPAAVTEGDGVPAPPIRLSPRGAIPPGPADAVERLLRDPSLPNNERGKGMLRLLHVNAVGSEQLPDATATVPPHCVAIPMQLARQYAKMWQDFA
jgi:hypothetical protein